MAVLLIGMLVTELLTEAVELTELVMHLKNENKPGETFAQALEDILSSPKEGTKVQTISVLRSEEEARATIHHRKKEVGFGDHARCHLRISPLLRAIFHQPPLWCLRRKTK